VGDCARADNTTKRNTASGETIDIFLPKLQIIFFSLGTRLLL
jgi:hypothetical protein